MSTSHPASKVYSQGDQVCNSHPWGIRPPTAMARGAGISTTIGAAVAFGLRVRVNAAIFILCLAVGGAAEAAILPCNNPETVRGIPICEATINGMEFKYVPPPSGSAIRKVAFYFHGDTGWEFDSDLIVDLARWGTPQNIAVGMFKSNRVVRSPTLGDYISWYALSEADTEILGHSIDVVLSQFGLSRDSALLYGASGGSAFLVNQFIPWLGDTFPGPYAANCGAGDLSPFSWDPVSDSAARSRIAIRYNYGAHDWATYGMNFSATVYEDRGFFVQRNELPQASIAQENAHCNFNITGHSLAFFDSRLSRESGAACRAAALRATGGLFQRRLLCAGGAAVTGQPSCEDLGKATFRRQVASGGNGTTAPKACGETIQVDAATAAVDGVADRVNAALSKAKVKSSCRARALSLVGVAGRQLFRAMAKSEEDSTYVGRSAEIAKISAALVRRLNLNGPAGSPCPIAARDAVEIINAFLLLPSMRPFSSSISLPHFENATVQVDGYQIALSGAATFEVSEYAGSFTFGVPGGAALSLAIERDRLSLRSATDTLLVDIANPTAVVVNNVTLPIDEWLGSLDGAAPGAGNLSFLQRCLLVFRAALAEGILTPWIGGGDASAVQAIQSEAEAESSAATMSVRYGSGSCYQGSIEGQVCVDVFQQEMYKSMLKSVLKLGSALDYAGCTAATLLMLRNAIGAPQAMAPILVLSSLCYTCALVPNCPFAVEAELTSVVFYLLGLVDSGVLPVPHVPCGEGSQCVPVNFLYGRCQSVFCAAGDDK
jgi:hypothetical protein